MVEIVNRIAECDDGRSRGLHGKFPDKIVVHRTLKGNAVEIARRYISDPIINTYTGKEVPYHFFIEHDRVVQTLRILDRGAHARRWNSSSVAVAVMWDPRYKPLPPAMKKNLIDLLNILCAWRGDVMNSLVGHDELPGGSKDKSKRCPAIDMNKLRLEIANNLIRSQKTIDQAGIVL